MQDNNTIEISKQSETHSNKCKKCGRELAEEVKFCPFCAAPVDPIQTESINRNKIIAIITVMAVVCIIAGMGMYKHFKSVPEKDNVVTVQQTTKPKVKPTATPEASAKAVETGALTADEMLRNEYFGYDPYLVLWRSPKAFLRNPAMFDGVKIGLGEKVEKILPTDTNDKFSIMCTIADTTMVLEGTYTDDTRYLEGDNVYLKGYYRGTRNITVDGKSLNVGVLADCSKVRISDTDSKSAYSLDEVRRVIRLIFGADVDVQTETDDDDVWYKFNIPNPNGGFVQWKFFGEGLNIIRASFDGGATMQRAIFTGDYKNYFTCDVRSMDKLAVIKYCELNGTILWTKEIPLKSNENTVEAGIIQGNIYVYCNEEIQIINPADGSVINNVVLTGNYTMLVDDNDTMLFYDYNGLESDGTPGIATVIAADTNGSILWKNEIKGCPEFYCFKESDGIKTLIIQSDCNTFKSFDRNTGEVKGEVSE